MCAKVKEGNRLYDHEVLEIILYSINPRLNTNPVAHKLLDRFCSISEIFKAEVEELKQVEGVGESTAVFLRTLGMCVERAGCAEGAAVLKNFGDCRRFVTMRMQGRTEEFLELYFLDKAGCVKRIYTYTSADRNKVVARADEIIKNIALVKPHGLLAAHNHLNGSAQPSENDEIFTAQLQLICNMNNVKFWDHAIYADGQYYSYRDTDELDEMSRKYSLNNVLKWINNSN